VLLSLRMERFRSAFNRVADSELTGFWSWLERSTIFFSSASRRPGNSQKIPHETTLL
jgi:hypothetical protein